jgi:hypothetical protein
MNQIWGAQQQAAAALKAADVCLCMTSAVAVQFLLFAITAALLSWVANMLPQQWLPHGHPFLCCCMTSHPRNFNSPAHIM